jgi:hypothetical protein
MRQTKRERRESIRQRALEMARSGEHPDFMSIELALRAEGYSEARGELDSRVLRDELNKLCKQSRSRPRGPRKRSSGSVD